MKQQVFYIHGGESYQQYEDFLKRIRTKDIWDLPGTAAKKKWTSALADDLGTEYEVFMPVFPNKQNAKYEEWKIWFERHFEHLHDGVILMGCSLGAMFLAKYISENELPYKIKALYLMANVVAEERGASLDDCGDFIFTLEQAKKLSERVKKIIIMHSKDDFVVPYEHAVALHEVLPGSELVTYEDKNHFLIKEFPELVAHIKSL